ncbi:hypothetical protein HYH03_006223 [Edaphochlamys debaryana]|uniref:C3H1-type domain-containing protein n=1 Tax=Edaphochlamys debaryana TaxID=47281 RepID=A0A835Y6G8_9CHLO|nr:hypothetical protein HYH03_006223 [Edaphochlamys debaryana]|eukprot:KAG2495623.1 hypothetical protein HYH03_006223 [Edaphochlamys debaryana]
MQGGTKLCHLLADEQLLRRLAQNSLGGSGVGEDCVSALRALNLPDSFWTDEFKVVPCAKTYSHKWTLCPCAHIGETARRRCPRSVNYKAVLCPLVKAKKTCPLGDACSYAHNVFEHWLHPSRYKTRLCSFGRNCNRSICFFAHSAEELRCVPNTDDVKEGDERDYLMHLLLAQENGMLAPPPAPMPPMPGVVDLQCALQQALQRPLPPSGRPSLNGLPDGLMPGSARQSVNGLPQQMSNMELMAARASLSGLQDPSGMLARASMSGMSDHNGMMMGRASMSGLPGGMHDASHMLGARTSLNGLADPHLSLAAMGGGMGSNRPSLTGVADHANMLLSMSVQNSMHRALSSELSGQMHAAAMQRALSSELGSDPMAAAAAAASAYSSATAAAAAMERAFSREMAASGAGSPLHSNAAQAAMDRAYSHRDPASASAAAMHDRALSHSRSMGSGGLPSSDRNHLSMNSVESDSLVQLQRVNQHGHGQGGHMGAQHPSSGPVGYESQQAPPRLSDPGTNYPGVPQPHAPPRPSDSGNPSPMPILTSKDFAGFESLLPLVNSALASGALSVPAPRRSNSGSVHSNSGRVVSPTLVDAAASPTHSGSRTPPSPRSALGAEAEAHHHHQQALLQQAAGSPPRPAHADGSAGLEAVMLRAAVAATAPGSAAAVAVASGGGNGGAAGVDQAYLQDLVARLQDQGVNKEQLVSSLSQLLAQLLSVSS